MASMKKCRIETWPEKFTVGDAYPRIGMRLDIPNAETEGYLFELLIERSDGICVTVPGILISEDDDHTLYSFNWVEESKSTVNLDVSLDPGVTLPAGSLAQNAFGEQFQTLSDVSNLTAFPSVETVASEAVLAGPVSTLPGTITEISVAVTGWTAVTNSAPGIDGQYASLVEGNRQDATLRMTLPNGDTRHFKAQPICVQERPKAEAV